MKQCRLWYFVILICIPVLIVSQETELQDISKKGPTRLLIARPNNFGYSVNPQTVWVSALIESFLYFKIDAFDDVAIIPIEAISPIVSAHRNFQKRVSKAKYLDAGKELSATHLLYSEYEVVSQEQVTLHITVEAVKGSATEKSQIAIEMDDFDRSLSEGIIKLGALLQVSQASGKDKNLLTSIIGKDSKKIKRYGTILVQSEGADKAINLKNATECERIKKSDGSAYLAYYLSSKLYAAADNMSSALTIAQELVSALGGHYPKLHLFYGRLLQQANNYKDAQKAIAALKTNSALKHITLFEQGVVYEALGDQEKAFQSFTDLLTYDEQNPAVYIHLAKLSVLLQKSHQMNTYVQKAAALSGKPEGEIYYSIGMGFVDSKDWVHALETFNKSVELLPNFANSWLVLGDIQQHLGKDEAAAESYLYLFHLDYLKFQEYLERAGKLFEKAGLVEEARRAYTEALDRYADPKIAILLAAIELKLGNYEKTKELLEPLGSPWRNDPKVVAMLKKSSKDRSAPVISLTGDNPLVLNAGVDTYVEPGATARDNEDGDMTNQMKLSGTVNASVVDTFTITYSVKDRANNVTSETRTVIVIDTIVPTITMNGGTTINVLQGKPYRELGAVAKDNCDGVISSHIETSGTVDVNTPGIYVVTYSVQDKAENSAIAERLINVLEPSTKRNDRKPPQINLIGGSPTTITVGDVYEEPTINATDDVDGDVTPFINIQGEVNPNKAGQYKVVYSVMDRSGNRATKTVVVKVKKAKVEKVPLASGGIKKKSKRKRSVAVLTGILGVGSLACGIITNNMLIPQRQDAYDKANNKDEATSKREILEKTALLRNLLYGGAGVFALGFTVNFLIPDPRAK